MDRCMWTGLICQVVLTVATLAPAADPGIRLPVAPVVPSPMPTVPVDPSPVTRLALDQLYVIDSDVPVIVLASPAHLVAVTEESGPLKVRGKFAGGSGKVETKTFGGKVVVVVEGLVTGRVELLVVPVGAKSVAEVVRRTIDVEAGEGPIPPPKPKPDPVKPDDGALGLAKASRAGMAKVSSANKAIESASLARAQRGIASAVAAGGLKEAKEILAAWRDANRAAAPADTWKPWGEVVSPALAKLYADGKLPNGKAWVAAFREIAEGLEG